MRHALPIWYCLDYETQAKLAPLLDEPDNIPPCLWAEWPALEAIEFKPLVHTEKEKAYFQAHNDAINRIMSQAPSRSRG